MSFDALFAPSAVGGRTLPNRIVAAPRSLRLSPEAMRAWFARRPGAGMCIVPGAAPHFTGKVESADPVLGEAYLEDFRAVAETIHASGARAVLQLSHAGAAADHPFALAASPMWNPQTKRRAHRAPVLGLPAIFHAYGRSAYLAVKEAGYDGVEIDGGGLSLPNTFFSGVINKRRDGCGRDRTRFGVELVERVRSYLGPTPILAFRLSLMDFDPEGPAWHEILTYAHALETAGVNCFSFALGIRRGEIPVQSAMTPPGTWIPVMEQFANELKSPVIFSGPLPAPEDLHELLVRRPGALVEVDRETTADPAWCAHVRADEPVRPCMRCAGGCPVHRPDEGLPACPSDPAAFIPDWEKPRAFASGKDVIVVGGGPAGMSAARAARLRGARVRLIEKRAQLGGGLLAAAKLPGQEGWAKLARDMAEELERLGVEVTTGVQVDAEWMIRKRVDAHVILAVGARPVIPDIPGIDGPNVLTYEDLMTDGVPVGRRVAVLGDTYAGRAVSAMLIAPNGNISREAWLRAWGIGSPVRHPGGMLGFVPHIELPMRSVTLISDRPGGVGAQILNTPRAYELQWLRMNGVQTVDDARLDSIDPYAIRIRVGEDSKEQHILRVDHIVLAMGCEPKKELANALRALAIPFEGVDSQTPPQNAWRASWALRNGFEAAMRLPD